jgi:hypothetical protein
MISKTVPSPAAPPPPYVVPNKFPVTSTIRPAYGSTPNTPSLPLLPKLTMRRQSERGGARLYRRDGENRKTRCGEGRKPFSRRAVPFLEQSRSTKFHGMSLRASSDVFFDVSRLSTLT